MKDLKEFKYQHQLDQSVVRKAPKTRSRFDLICGVLLGGLAFGIIFPSAKQYLINEAKNKTAQTHSTSSLAAKSGAANKKRGTLAKPPLAKAVVAKTSVPAAAIALSTPAPTKAEIAKVTPTAKLAKAPAKILKKTTVKVKEQAPAKPKTQLSQGFTPKRIETSLVETDATISAEQIAAKSDANLLIQETRATSFDTSDFVTISNAQYQKDGLANCKQRCIIKGKDAKGVAISAVISGPNFADILAEHQGTINLTGVKRTVRNHEVFMVQNITFNMPNQKGAAVESNETRTPPAESLRVSGYKAAPLSGDAEYEDLTQDPAPITPAR